MVGRLKGPVVWRDEQRTVVLFYGSVGDDSSTNHEDTIPLYDRPHLTVSESTVASPLHRGAGAYIPSEGSVFVAAGAKAGFLQIDGLHVSIGADGEAAILAAAGDLIERPRVVVHRSHPTDALTGARENPAEAESVEWAEAHARRVGQSGVQLRHRASSVSLPCQTPP